MREGPVTPAPRSLEDDDEGALAPKVRADAAGARRGARGGASGPGRWGASQRRRQQKERASASR